MNLIETKHHSSNGCRLHTGIIHIAAWNGIILVEGYSVEIYLWMKQRRKKHEVFKAYREFETFGKAKRFAINMSNRYTSLKSIYNLGFERF
jgi:hypothetical protein